MSKKWSEPKGKTDIWVKRTKPKKIGKHGKADVYIDTVGNKFIYVKKYGQKKRVRDYTKF